MKMRMTSLLALLLLAAVGASAQTIRSISSSPLTINVASDGSFQVYNDAVPGTGQIFPDDCDIADMGLMLNIDGALFAPNFRGHGCGSATGNLGDYTAWTPLGISEVLGDGSVTSPFTVFVSLGAGGTDVTARLTVTYVSGRNYFRIRKEFFTSSTHTANAFLGADIFLAGNDSGIYHLETTLSAPGGRNCEEAESYNILLIPLTTATRFTSSSFSDVWAQIAANELDNDATPEGCIDNGSALQWNNVFGHANAVRYDSALSFGEIPPVARFQGFALSTTQPSVNLRPGDTLTFRLDAQHNAETDFDDPLTFFAELPAGITATFNPTGVAAPGDGSTTVTLRIADNIFPSTYPITLLASGGGEVHGTTFNITVQCDPPFVLAINAPQSQTIKRGSRATLRVKSEASGGSTYQWFNGVAPMTGSPVAGATSAEFTTPVVNDIQQYWVRVSNACGTADAGTATIIPVD